MTGTTEAVPTRDGALLRYRVMANVVGTLLVVLVCVAVPLQVWADSKALVTVVGIAHGYLFLVMLLTRLNCRHGSQTSVFLSSRRA